MYMYMYLYTRYNTRASITMYGDVLAGPDFTIRPFVFSFFRVVPNGLDFSNGYFLRDIDVRSVTRV